MTNETLLQLVSQYYLESHDFNGYGIPDDVDLESLIHLIEVGLLSLNRGDRHPNSHVKAFEPEPAGEQIAKIRSAGLAGCLYPEPKHLVGVVDTSQYAGRPFTMRLALGEPQLKLVYFDLSVLENYRNDPRYHFDVDDVHGSISVTSKYYDSPEMREADQTFLETFGFGYDKDFNRAVCAFLRYLHNMSPEHQRLWELKELSGEFSPHPDYWRTSIMGQFPERGSLFTAFLEELHHSNGMAELMGMAPIYRSDFTASRPRDFGFLLRPTLREFNNFVHLLDRMMSENLNRDFFRDDVPLEREKDRGDGRVVVEQKGTIQLLDEWTARISFPDPGPRERMIATFKKIRRMRQNPAHALNVDVFDQKYFKEQRELAIEAYSGVRVLRLILANHPSVQGYEVPEWLYKGDIWSM